LEKKGGRKKMREENRGRELEPNFGSRFDVEGKNNKSTE